MNLIKRKYIVYFVSKTSDKTYYCNGIKRIKPTTTELKLSKDKVIRINTQFPAFSKGFTSYFYADNVEGKLVYFEESEKPKFTAKYYNRLVKEKFFLDATSNLEKPNNLINIGWLIVGAIIGAPIGICFGYFLFGKMFPLMVT